MELCAGLSESEAETIVRQFAELLIERRQGALLTEVIEAIRVTPEPGTVRVKLTTADKAPDESVNEFKDALEKMLKASVDIETSEEPDIIGGAVIRYEDTLLDASVRSRLDRLRHQLTE